ncbi:unnamed protein product [Musa acuminata subsp. malaccensis]|uniref:(wild Malaysian banana) hypothetical protein n=1 Tax=Musa acuminata subsp. malaccensis TaxID=214687 RepID=A0A804JHM2_MUSAM|nr:PREDICTED: transcription factor bHLH84-like [Musa acuminata subsp. malaccensis]CAG1846638.1 unnamed protein product [Musa acuminata subsp. malaccensis]
MEPQGLALEASWKSFDPLMSVEESEVMTQLFCSMQDQDPSTGIQHLLCFDHNANTFHCSDDSGCNPYYWNQGICTPAADEGYYLLEQIATPSFPVEVSSDEAVESIPKPHLPDPHASQAIKRGLHVGDHEVPAMVEEDDNHVGSLRKKARAMAPVTSKKVHRSGRYADEEERNGDMNLHGSCCYSSEDDSNGSQELKGAGATSCSSKGSAVMNPNERKTRAGRGSATDPQSLYARKRRQRINERLRILQSLIPNGTKVDISTMLEEAVRYVKFLQLQIKLLSSEELWMYAPIAYNGMNLGFDLKISPQSQQ